jgi:hypothetical protein
LTLAEQCILAFISYVLIVDVEIGEQSAPAEEVMRGAKMKRIALTLSEHNSTE